MTLALFPTLFFFDPQTEENKRQAPKTRVDGQPKKERRLFCAACRHPVTHQDQCIEVAGRHDHAFTNPHGVTYYIGCYREAPGCAAVGEATTEYTWFAGYAWRIALCANCRAHLGWRFQSQENYFHGLIVARLTSAGTTGN